MPNRTLLQFSKRDNLSGSTLNAIRSRKIRSRIIISTVVVAIIGGICAILLVIQISSVRSDLTSGMNFVPKIVNELEQDDVAAARVTLGELGEKTSAARVTVEGPVWRGASLLPLIGPNLRAVAEATVSADEVVTRAVDPLLETLEDLSWDTLTPRGGRIDTSSLSTSAPTITAAADTVRLSAERMAGIDTDSLLPSVAEPIATMTEQMQEMASTLDVASYASRLVPSMLGSETPKRYLVLIQNNAESRATGGIPGALAILTTDDGHVSLGEQTSAADIQQFSPPLEVDKEQEKIFTSRLGRHMQNVNLTPDFPTVASTAKRMWEERHPGENLDGVVALDPVVLSHLLGATGAVSLQDPAILSLVEGTALPLSLTSENVVPTLLSDVYREIQDPALQDAYFASVAAEVFDAFANGQGDGTRLMEALRMSSIEGRLYLWSNTPTEQDLISRTSLAGDVTGHRSGGASFGMYFNDGTGAKMDYYAERQVQLVRACSADGYGEYRLRVTLTNTAPTDAEHSLPAYVTGGGAFGVKAGNIRTNYVAYGPSHARIQTVTVNGALTAFGSGTHAQRPVGTVSVELTPGEKAELEFKFLNVVQESEPILMVTPTPTPMERTVMPAVRDSSCE